MLWGNMVSELSGEALSRYSNKIESVYENVRIISILLRKWRHTKSNISPSLPRIMAGKQLAQLTVWRNYVTVILPKGCLLEELKKKREEVTGCLSTGERSSGTCTQINANSAGNTLA